MPWSDKAKQGETGLADKYQLYIPKGVTNGDVRLGAWFGYPYKNAAQAAALCLYGERMIDGEIDDGHLWLSVGAFEPGDKEGSFIIHETGREDRFPSQNSKFGKFLASANEVGLLDELENRQDPGRAALESRDALIWEDITLDIEEVVTPARKDEKSGEEFPASRQPLVRGFRLGRSFVTEDGAAAASSTPAASTNGGGGSDELKDKAVELAKSSDDYMSYLEAAAPLGIEPGHPLADEMFFKGARA